MSRPSGAYVHHVDGDRTNDASLDLVVFFSQEYHAELHVSANALGHFQLANPEREMAAA